MLDQRAFLRVQEGSYVFLLAADQAVSIERRQPGNFESVAREHSALCAWYVASGARVPVIRLAGLLAFPAGDWGYAILLAGRTERVAIAAEHIHVVLESEMPMVQRFNPAGVAVQGEPIITGVCPDTAPEYLVLEPSSLCRCALRAVDHPEGR